MRLHIHIGPRRRMGGGCASFFGGLIVLGLALKFWYIALPLFVILVAVQLLRR